MKLNALIAVLSLALGGGLVWKFKPAIACPPCLSKQKEKLIEYRPDGSISSVRLSESESQKENNLLFLLDQREVSAIIKIENLHFGLGYDYKNPDIIYKVGYSTRVF